MYNIKYILTLDAQNDHYHQKLVQISFVNIKLLNLSIIDKILQDILNRYSIQVIQNIDL